MAASLPAIHADVNRALLSIFLSKADEAARRTGFTRRESKLSGSVFVQTLTFGWLHNPHATLEELAQVATHLGVPISPQGLDQRFGPPAAALLEQVLQDAVLRVLSTDPVAVPVLQRFPGGVDVLDTTTLTLPAVFAGAWPGSGQYESPAGAGIKAQVRLNLVNGSLTGPFLFPARDHDQVGTLHSAPLAPGTLLLADLGFFSLDRFQELDQAKVYWLSRVQVGTSLTDASGRVQTAAAFLREHQDKDMVEMSVAMGATHRLPCRLIAIRVPPHVAAERRRNLRKGRRGRHSRKRNRQGRLCNVHPDRWVLAEWNVYVTNAPPELLSARDAWVLARCRWQIELLFKLWKSEGHVDESRSQKPWRILCEIYAKLLGMVVQHWLLLVGCWSHADRSLVKASRTVRRYAPSLAVAVRFCHGHMVLAILANIENDLRTGCRVNRRRRAPPTHQLLTGLPEAR